MALKQAMKQSEKYKVVEVKLPVKKKMFEELVAQKGTATKLVKQALNKLYPKLVY